MILIIFRSLLALTVVAALAACGGGGDQQTGSGPAAETTATIAAAPDTTAAAASPTSAEPLAVVASFYPVEEAARRVGGHLVDVTDLTPPGGEPHDLELTAAALSALERASVVLYLGDGFQPAVEKAVANVSSSVTAVDLLHAVSLRSNDPPVQGVQGEVDQGELADKKDPHVWVDPQNFMTMVKRVRDSLAAADPSGTATFAANADAYLRELRDLDEAFATTLSTCKTKVLVTSHAAFGYVADRYGLTQAPIAGITPEDEPDPKSLAATAKLAESAGVKTVFFESLVPKTLSETVAREIGATTDKLDPVEGIAAEDLAKGASYLTIQRENLASLAKGLGCTTP